MGYNPKRCIKNRTRIVGRKAVPGKPCDLTGPYEDCCIYCWGFHPNPPGGDFGQVEPPHGEPVGCLLCGSAHGVHERHVCIDQQAARIRTLELIVQSLQERLVGLERVNDPQARTREDEPCTRPPAGWRCSRPEGHDGPCAATLVPKRRPATGKKRSHRTKH